MGKTLSVLALLTALGWPAAVLGEMDGQIPTRGMKKSQVHDHFGKPEHKQGPVGDPPISRWDYPGFSVYFENNTTLHSVREQGQRIVSSGEEDDQPAYSTAAAEAGVSAANGEEPPTSEEEQETQIEVKTYNKPNKEDSEEEETSSESDTAPGSTAVRAKANDTEETDNTSNPEDQGEGRFKFDPATGRIVISEDEVDTQVEGEKHD